MLVLISAVGLAACSGRHSDRQIQLCLESEEGVAAFRQILVAISVRHELEFFDQSGQVERDLKALKSDLVGHFPLHHYHLHNKPDGVEVTASNLSLGPYETTLSYDLRNDRQKALAEDLNASLGRKFKIVRTPDNRGAFPLPDCPRNGR